MNNFGTGRSSAQIFVNSNHREANICEEADTRVQTSVELTDGNQLGSTRIHY